MAITTYSELQTAVANWLNKSNLTSRIPEFIALAEGRLNRRLRSKEMESVSSGLTLTSGTDTYSLPANALTISKFVVTTGGVDYQLDQMSKTLLIRKFPYNTPTIPSAFAMDGNQLIVRATPDGDYDYELSYYTAIPDLETNSTNWLLSRYPDVYLAGACLEGAHYVRNMRDVAYWESRFNQGIEEIKNLDKRDRWGGGSLRVRTI